MWHAHNQTKYDSPSTFTYPVTRLIYGKKLPSNDILPVHGDDSGIGPSVVPPSLCAASLKWLFGKDHPGAVTWSI